MKTRVAILGEFDATRPSRVLLGPALEHSAATLGIDVEYFWVPPCSSEVTLLHQCDAVFIGPGEASEDTTGILSVIRSARLNRIPCLGTCGGFQRVIAEYAHNELGFKTLEHEEISPDAADPFFSQLSCSLVGKDAEVQLVSHSLAAQIYSTTQTVESFFCRYGINGKYLLSLQSAGLIISGYDSLGEARIIELPGHPFFMATLFVPQVRSTESQPYPIISAFLRSTIQ